MSEQQDVPPSEEMIPNPHARRRRRWHWLFAFVVLVGGTSYIMSRPTNPAEPENVPPEMQITPPPPVTEDPGAVIPPPVTEDPSAMAAPPAPGRAVASDEADPLADPLAPIESTDMNPPPPAPTPIEDTPPPVAAEPEAAPAPEPPPPPAPKVAKKKKESKPKKTKSYAIVFSKSATKVPKGFKKDKVLKFLAKKLDGDKTCLPKNMEKKNAKPFTAIVNVSKSGTVTAVTTQPKMPDGKKIATCIKKKLGGSPATFKSSGNSSSRILVSLKMK